MGTPINAHLKEMKVLADKLASDCAPVSDEDEVVTLLGSLLSYLTRLLHYNQVMV